MSHAPSAALDRRHRLIREALVARADQHQGGASVDLGQLLVSQAREENGVSEHELVRKQVAQPPARGLAEAAAQYHS